TSSAPRRSCRRSASMRSASNTSPSYSGDEDQIAQRLSELKGRSHRVVTTRRRQLLLSGGCAAEADLTPARGAMGHSGRAHTDDAHAETSAQVTSGVHRE